MDGGLLRLRTVRLPVLRLTLLRGPGAVPTTRATGPVSAPHPLLEILRPCRVRPPCPARHRNFRRASGAVEWGCPWAVLKEDV